MKTNPFFEDQTTNNHGNWFFVGEHESKPKFYHQKASVMSTRGIII